MDHTANVRKVNAQAGRIGSDYNPSWAAQEVFQHAASLAYLAMVGDATQSDGHLLRPCDGVTVDDDFPRFRTVGACFLDQSLDLTIGLVAAHVIVLHPVESRNTETSSRGKLRAPNSSSSSDGGKVAVRYAVLHIGPAMDCLAVHFDGQGPTDVSTFSAIIVCKIAGQSAFVNARMIQRRLLDRISKLLHQLRSSKSAHRNTSRTAADCSSVRTKSVRVKVKPAAGLCEVHKTKDGAMHGSTSYGWRFPAWL